jgi:hypothetical protein
MCQVSPDMLANMINQWVAKEKKNALGAGYVHCTRTQIISSPRSGYWQVDPLAHSGLFSSIDIDLL